MVTAEDDRRNQTGDKMKDVLKAITDRFNIANDFKTAISSRFYLNTAPQGIAKPYTVFQLITNTATYNFTSTFDDTEIQIDIIDDNNSSDILDIADKCMSHFDDCDLAVNGYQFLKMERDLNFLEESPDEEIQRYTIQYTISTRK